MIDIAKKESYQDSFKKMLDDMIYGKRYNGRIQDIRAHWAEFIIEYEKPWWKKIFRRKRKCNGF